MSTLSNVQFSRFSELEVAKLLVLGTGGLLEAILPMTDDERRDMETHLKNVFNSNLALQVKARHVLVRHNRADLLFIRFNEKRERLIADRFFWYVFGYMDLATMQYRAPMFLVPSEVVHRHADPRVRGDIVRLTFAASMDPRSKDQWHAYGCEPGELGQRVVEFLRAQARRRKSADRLTLAPAVRQPGTIIVARAA